MAELILGHWFPRALYNAYFTLMQLHQVLSEKEKARNWILQGLSVMPGNVATILHTSGRKCRHEEMIEQKDRRELNYHWRHGATKLASLQFPSLRISC